MGQFAVGNYCNAFQSSFASVFLIFTALCMCLRAHSAPNIDKTCFSGFVAVHAQNIIATATRATHTHMHAYAHMCATGLVMLVVVNLSGCEKSSVWANKYVFRKVFFKTKYFGCSPLFDFRPFGCTY